MLAVLSAVMLTGLAATTIQARPVFADKEECKDNGDNNCNEQSQDLKLNVKCKTEVENKDHSDGNTNALEKICSAVGIDSGRDTNNNVGPNSDQIFGPSP